MHSVETVAQILNFGIFWGKQYAAWYSVVMLGGDSRSPQSAMRPEGKQMV